MEEVHVGCPTCGSLLDIVYQWDRVPLPGKLADFEEFWSKRDDPARFSGLWRFHELLPFVPLEKVVTIGEGQTILQEADRVGQFVGLQPGCLFLQYEGMNPSGSFKDNGLSLIHI